MSQQQKFTVEVIYNRKSVQISCSENEKYEDFLKMVMERLSIRPDFLDFTRISSGQRYIFDDDSFQNSLQHYTHQENPFEITVDYTSVLDDLNLCALNPFGTSSLRDKSTDFDEFKCVPVTRQNCFIETLPGDMKR